MNAVQGMSRRDREAVADRDDNSLLDRAHIDQLCAVLGSKRVAALFVLLSKELESRPMVIRNAVAAGDVSRARYESHSFKGATTSVGAVALGKVAGAIERAPDLQAMAAWLPALDRQAARTRRAFAGFHPSYAPGVEPG